MQFVATTLSTLLATILLATIQFYCVTCHILIAMFLHNITMSPPNIARGTEFMPCLSYEHRRMRRGRATQKKFQKKIHLRAIIMQNLGIFRAKIA